MVYFSVHVIGGTDLPLFRIGNNQNRLLGSRASVGLLVAKVDDFRVIACTKKIMRGSSERVHWRESIDFRIRFRMISNTVHISILALKISNYFHTWGPCEKKSPDAIKKHAFQSEKTIYNGVNLLSNQNRFSILYSLTQYSVKLGLGKVHFAILALFPSQPPSGNAATPCK